MTLTQTEKGYPPPIEHVGIPAAIREEKGNDTVLKSVTYVSLSYELRYEISKDLTF